MQSEIDKISFFDGFLCQVKRMKIQFGAKRMRKALATAFLVVALGSGSAWAEGERITFESCGVCHGPASRESSIPHIQGMPFSDLLGLLGGFSADTTKSTIMHRLLVGMPEADLEGLARFISQIKEPS